MKRCLLVGAAPSTGKGLDYVLQTQTFDAIFAVDGGFEEVRKRSLVPDAVFGDFDSLGFVPDHPHVVTYDPYKDFTDLDLALHHVSTLGFEEVVICNAFVGRLDHTIGNMQILIRMAAQGLCVWGIEEDAVIAPLVAPGPFSSLSFEQGVSGTCSVISHSDCTYGVNEAGLEWSVENATCTNRALWGISNEFKEKPACISLDKGSLWVIFPLQEFTRAYYDRMRYTQPV